MKIVLRNLFSGLFCYHYFKDNSFDHADAPPRKKTKRDRLQKPQQCHAELLTNRSLQSVEERRVKQQQQQQQQQGYISGNLLISIIFTLVSYTMNLNLFHIIIFCVVFYVVVYTYGR